MVPPAQSQKVYAREVGRAEGGEFSEFSEFS